MYRSRNEPAEPGRSLSRFRPDIEGLRGVAVLSVVAHHAERQLVPGGYLGVDIFFVISGYVITASLLASPPLRLHQFVFNAYARRMKRLLPALLLCLTVSASAICLFDPNPVTSLLTALAALVGLSNVYLFLKGTDYFAAASELNAFTHTWSLGVEEQFYLLYPLLFWACAFSPRPGAGWRLHTIRVIAALSVVSMGTAVVLDRVDPPAAYFLLPARLWEFGIGALVCLCRSRTESERIPFARIVADVTLASLILVLCLPLSHSVGAAAAATLTALVVGLVQKGSLAYSVLSSSPLSYLGRISYSLYLWHWSVFALGKLTITAHWWSTPLLLTAILLLAIASYHFVEQPLRRAEWSSSPARTLGYGLGGSFAIGGVILGLSMSSPGGTSPGKLAEWLGVRPAIVPATREFDAADGERLAQLESRMRACNMTPHHLSGSNYAPKPIVDSAFVDRCTRRSGAAARKLVLLGDSFAHIMARHFARSAQSIGYEFKLLFGYGCPYPFPFGSIVSGTFQRCPEVDEDLLRARIAQDLLPGDIVVIRLDYPAKHYLKYPISGLPPVDAYDGAISSLQQAIREKGAYLFLIGANPTLTHQELASLKIKATGAEPENAWKGPLDDETRYYLDHDRHLRETLAARDHLFYFSTSGYFCETNEMCAIRKSGTPVYRDLWHISQAGIELFYPDLAREIVRVSSEMAAR